MLFFVFFRPQRLCGTPPMMSARSHGIAGGPRGMIEPSCDAKVSIQ